MRAIVGMIVLLACACQKTSKDIPAATTDGQPGSASPAAMPQMRVGSALFHLEIGHVYERFQDRKSAAEHYSQALPVAETVLQRVQIYSALGRVKDDSGDTDAAIDSLEHALGELGKVKAGDPSNAVVRGMPPMPGMAQGMPMPRPPGRAPVMPVGDDVTGRLVRLYLKKGRFEQAERFCTNQLAAAHEPWQREQIYRLQVEVYQRAGSLDEQIAEREKALEQSPQDEAALRFLAVAFGERASKESASIGPTSGAQSKDLANEIRIYEQLLRLRPDDPQVRQRLQALFERAGQVDDAVKLAAQATSTGLAECRAGTAPLITPRLHAAAEAIRIRVRARQGEAALAETAKLADLNAGEGIAANLLAAQLYLEQGEADRASDMIKQAAQRGKSRDDQRLVAFAREQELARRGSAEELKALYADWQKSDDPCLRMAAAQRERQGMVAGTMAAGAPVSSPRAVAP